MTLAERLARRRFHWISSVAGDPASLDALEEAMAGYYGQHGTRGPYQELIDSTAASQPDTEHALCAAIVAHHPKSVLEVGCGSGRLYRRLRAAGFQGSYIGVEMSRAVVDAAAAQFPDATWTLGSMSRGQLPQGPFDVVFSYFVLEHCIRPERALAEMVARTAKSGAVLAVFPDFVEMGRLASQCLGIVDGRAGERLRRGDALNALFNFYEARVRLPRALRTAVRDHGPFPINIRPRCLLEGSPVAADVDAVYIASKAEVASWARGQGLHVSYPSGTLGQFRVNALVEITRDLPR